MLFRSVRTAIRLGNEHSELIAMKKRLAARDTPFFDTQARVRDLEDAFLAMWRGMASRAR